MKISSSMQAKHGQSCVFISSRQCATVLVAFVIATAETASHPSAGAAARGRYPERQRLLLDMAAMPAERQALWKQPKL